MREEEMGRRRKRVAVSGECRRWLLRENMEEDEVVMVAVSGFEGWRRRRCDGYCGGRRKTARV